jgi:Leucine-rich repeat (LRR) protein
MEYICKKITIEENDVDIQQKKYILNICVNKLVLPTEFGYNPNIKKLSTIDLTSCNLSKLPESFGHLEYLSELTLSMNNFIEIPECLTKLTNINTLSMCVNKIEIIPDSLSKMTNLTKLYLGINKIKKIPESLCSMTKLVDLSLEYNNITYIPYLIKNLSNLKYLDLKLNKNIKKLPESIWQLDNLLELNCEDNPLAELPKNFGNFSNLSRLKIDIYDVIIPESFKYLTKLENLNIYTSIKSYKNLEDFIKNFTHLTKLKIYCENLEDLTEDFGKLTKLNLLEIKGRLTGLPETIGNLTNLQTLILSDNCIKLLPETIGNLTNLKKLEVANNQLIKLPESIKNLTNLSQLSLRSNLFQELPICIDKIAQVFINDATWDIRNLSINCELLIYSSITKLTNLPVELKKIYVDNIKKDDNIKIKLPFGCEIMQRSLEKYPVIFEYDRDFYFNFI